MDRTFSARLPWRSVLLGATISFLPGGLLLAGEEEPRLALYAEPPALPAMTELDFIADDLDAMAEKRRLEKEAELRERLRFFDAIAEGDTKTFTRLLAEGVDPDSEVPFPPALEFSRKFHDELLRFYVAKEPGFTGLMMASAMGNAEFVKQLLAAGAKPFKTTKKYKTFALWLAGKYQQVEIMQMLLKASDDALQCRISIDLESQRAFFWRGEKIEFYTDISSGRNSHPTPKGRYVVTNKYRTWKSTLYPAKMPYFLRLSCGDFGLHAGNLPGYPASHGCIRLPETSAKKLFADVPIGTLVEIR